MNTAIVRWFNGNNGVGFIRPSDGSPEVFVHHFAIQGHGFKSPADGLSAIRVVPVWS
ncbi:MAG: cold shock domain-containing protein [Gammaproteobacteria bacterium]